MLRGLPGSPMAIGDYLLVMSFVLQYRYSLVIPWHISSPPASAGNYLPTSCLHIHMLRYLHTIILFFKYCSLFCLLCRVNIGLRISRPGLPDTALLPRILQTSTDRVRVIMPSCSGHGYAIAVSGSWVTSVSCLNKWQVPLDVRAPWPSELKSPSHCASEEQTRPQRLRTCWQRALRRGWAMLDLAEVSGCSMTNKEPEPR